MAYGVRREACVVTHRPIMLREVLHWLRPTPGDVAVDCTLGAGGHAMALLERILPGGRLIGLDVDPLELPQTEARMRASGFGRDVFAAHRRNFADLEAVFAEAGVAGADIVLADLGVSAMQHDVAARGFSYKLPGPLDLRLDPSAGRPASRLLEALDETQLSELLTAHADEPHAETIASLVMRQPVTTTHALERVVRTGLAQARPDLSKADLKRSVRRTFQALRIAVNDEFGALERFLEALPRCLAPGGRVVVLTFHSGEDRRVKQAFRTGRRNGTYAMVADRVVRSTKEETFTNRRSSSAKLRWAVRAEGRARG